MTDKFFVARKFSMTFTVAEWRMIAVALFNERKGRDSDQMKIAARIAEETGKFDANGEPHNA